MNYSDDGWDETLEIYYKDKMVYNDYHCSCNGFEFQEYHWTIKDFIKKGLGIDGNN